MGKASKWFRSLLGSKKSSARAPPSKDWGTGDGPPASPYAAEGLDANTHAMAVAAATAAVAEAALAAAQAAAEVVRLTSGGGGGGGRSRERRRVDAAVRIQAAFRAYLARRALRALKALVKLQALVRGHIVRKQSADMLRRMQAMARIQARASSARRSYAPNRSYTNIISSKSLHPSTLNPKKIHDQPPKTAATRGGSKQENSRFLVSKKENPQLAPNWLDHWMQQTQQDKILEIDTWKPRQKTKHTATSSSSSASHVAASRYFSAWNSSGQEISGKAHKPNPASVCSEEEASNNPRGLFADSRSAYGGGDYVSHRNYMSNTESSRAKAARRSQSAPKQRLRLEELGVSIDDSDRGYWDSDAFSEKGFSVIGRHHRSSSARRGGGFSPKKAAS